MQREKSVKLLQAKRTDLLAFEKRLAASEPQAILNRLHNMAMDRFDDQPGSNVKCNCDEEGPHSTHSAFLAFPNDTSKMLLCCVDCGTVHFIGEEEATGIVSDDKPIKSD